MIVSIQYRYIFWCPRKVASSSVLYALGKQAGPDDIVADPAPLEGLPAHGNTSLDPHTRPEFIKQHCKISDEHWAQFRKTTLVRNPWDECVGRFWFTAKPPPATPRLFEAWRRPHTQRLFEACLQTYDDRNAVFYFGADGQRIADRYLRFEALADEYRAFCLEQRIPHEPLPHLKRDRMSPVRPYQHYYTPATRQLVADRFHQTIHAFGYRFDG